MSLHEMGQVVRRRPPADPAGVELSYSFRHHWDSDGQQDPDIWHVSADIPDAEDEDGEAATIHVGDIEIVLIDPYRRYAFEALDGHSADLSYIGGAILVPGAAGLDPAFADRLECFGTGLLILNRVQLAPEWRGFGIGVLLAGLAIQRLSGGCVAAVCHAAPIDDDPDQTEAAADKLGDVWAQLGFRHFRDGVYYLDLAHTTLDNALRQLRVRIASR